MRIGLIADIHGNLVSLEAVLADIDRQGVDRVLCLGDLATLGPQPREVVARIRALGCPCVMGNHESFLLDRGLMEAYTDSTELHDMVDWCAELLSEADLDFVRSFPPLIEITLGPGATMLCYHGSPRSNMDRILPTTPADELDGMLAGRAAAVMAGAHQHVQMVRQFRGQLLLTVGSVGQPFDEWPFEDRPRLLPCAEYTIVDWSDGAVSVELRRVHIDLEAVKQAARESTMPDTDFWVGWWMNQGESVDE
jgi:predicted phosphodiesterase